MKHTGIGIALTGSGSATPAASLSNEDLSCMVETSDEWIETRTGMKVRQVASPEDTLVDLAARAGLQAIAAAGLETTDIDLVLLATSTPDDLFGSAPKVQALLGANRAVAFDLTAACSGFAFALVTAAQYLRSGVFRNVLVVGADLMSRWLDWSDRSTCVLFADGAGAVVMQAAEIDRFLGFELRSDGAFNDCLQVPFVGTPRELVPGTSVAEGGYHPVRMNGKEVYRFVVREVPDAIEKALYRAAITVEDVDWFILHQANQRILDAVAQRLDVLPQKVLSNVARYGNTSAASIPLMLDEAVRSGKIQPGETIAIAGFGAGLNWGAVVFRWGP